MQLLCSGASKTIKSIKKTVEIMNTQFKVIIKGRLAFGTQKCYESMIEHYRRRLELYYRNDIFFKDEEHFKEEDFVISMPRTTMPMCSEKTWKNTVNLFNELRTFAIAGSFSIWVLDYDGKVLVKEEIVTPQGDKFVTSTYLRGASLLETKGKEEEAIELFDKAIEKYEAYEEAYERRGVANHRLGRFEDAMLDFSKSLNLYFNPEALLGRAIVKRSLGDLKGALVDLDLAVKNSVPYQPIFWASRRVKGEVHLELNQLQEAIFELKLVTKRAFKETDPNFKHRRKAWEMYAITLEKAGMRTDSAAAFQSSKSIEIIVEKKPAPKEPVKPVQKQRFAMA